MRKLKKSKGFKGILLFLLAVSVLISVFSGMYMMVGSDYANIGKEKEDDFFVSQESTQSLIDGYIRLYEEYMQIGKLITTDGNIDYDKEILVSVIDGKSYTIKELLKDSLSEGEASRMFREFMDEFEENCKVGKSYSWVTRHILKSDSRVILDNGNIYRFNSSNAKEFSAKKIENMKRYQKNMVPLTTDVDTYMEEFEESITLRLADSDKTEIVYNSKSNYEAYLVTYFPTYAKCYFLNNAVAEYEETKQGDLLKIYTEFCEKNDSDISKSKFKKLLQKSAKKYEDMLSEDEIPWEVHVLPRTMAEAKRYVTFLVETYQEMKYLFSRTNFFYSYENSKNLLITNNERCWTKVNREMLKDRGPSKVVDADSMAYAYFDGKSYEGKTNFKNEFFQMSGNIMEMLQKIGTQYHSSTYKICVGLDLQGVRSSKYEDEFVHSYLESHRKFELFQTGKRVLLVGVIMGVLCFLLLAIVSGYSKEKDAYVLNWYDKIWVEIQLLAGYIFINMSLWLLQLWGGADSLIMVLVFGTTISMLAYCCLGILISIIKCQKMHCLMQHSIIVSFVKEVVIHKMHIKDWYKERRNYFAFLPPHKKQFVLFLYEAAMILYLFGCAFFVKMDKLVTIRSFIMSPLGVITGIIACVFVFIIIVLQKKYFRCEEVEHMMIEGTKRIVEGEFDFQFSSYEGIGYREAKLLNILNRFGEVLEKAVDESVRSERMKTELIANVSHDIKTPLTSVINYIDLLKRLEVQDETAQKYVDILVRKSLRLKTLIDDLVEASKASSGVMELDMRRLNFNELIRQTDAEFEDRYEEKNLELISDIPEENLFFEGDGRRVFRILENLYNNTAKYAMEHTRVYVSLECIGDRVIFSMKNVSATKLNITPEELTERFVRGERSRTTEGSGLGLSIAKSLTELMNGEFVIELDGDLFCAKVSFPIAKAEHQVLN